MLAVVLLLSINLKNDHAQVSGCFLQSLFLVEVVDDDVAEIRSLGWTHRAAATSASLAAPDKR